MGDLPSNVNEDNLSSSYRITEQSHYNFNYSNNETLPSTGNSSISYETMRIYFLAITAITILICLTICIVVCTCICRKRRQKSKSDEKKDQLLPEQSKKTSMTINGKQTTSIQPTIVNSKVPVGSFYYDHLDDIPFIDESRPTSVVDIAQV